MKTMTKIPLGLQDRCGLKTLMYNPHKLQQCLELAAKLHSMLWYVST